MQTRQTSPSTLKSAWRLDATDIGRDVIRIEGQAEPVCPFSVGGHETIGSIPQRLVRDVDVLPARDLVLLIRDEVSPLDFRALLWCVPDSEVGSAHEEVAVPLGDLAAAQRQNPSQGAVGGIQPGNLREHALRPAHHPSGMHVVGGLVPRADKVALLVDAAVGQVRAQVTASA